MKLFNSSIALLLSALLVVQVVEVVSQFSEENKGADDTFPRNTDTETAGDDDTVVPPNQELDDEQTQQEYQPESNLKEEGNIIPNEDDSVAQLVNGFDDDKQNQVENESENDSQVFSQEPNAMTDPMGDNKDDETFSSIGAENGGSTDEISGTNPIPQTNSQESEFDNFNGESFLSQPGLGDNENLTDIEGSLPAETVSYNSETAPPSHLTAPEPAASPKDDHKKAAPVTAKKATPVTAKKAVSPKAGPHGGKHPDPKAKKAAKNAAKKAAKAAKKDKLFKPTADFTKEVDALILKHKIVLKGKPDLSVKVKEVLTKYGVHKFQKSPTTKNVEKYNVWIKNLHTDLINKALHAKDIDQKMHDKLIKEIGENNDPKGLAAKFHDAKPAKAKGTGKGNIKVNTKGKVKVNVKGKGKNKVGKGGKKPNPKK